MLLSEDVLAQPATRLCVSGSRSSTMTQTDQSDVQVAMPLPIQYPDGITRAILSARPGAPPWAVLGVIWTGSGVLKQAHTCV